MNNKEESDRESAYNNPQVLSSPNSRSSSIPTTETYQQEVVSCIESSPVSSTEYQQNLPEQPSINSPSSSPHSNSVPHIEDLHISSELQQDFYMMDQTQEVASEVPGFAEQEQVQQPQGDSLIDITANFDAAVVLVEQDSGDKLSSSIENSVFGATQENTQRDTQGEPIVQTLAGEHTPEKNEEDKKNIAEVVEQPKKRFNHDILKAFFRVYFRVDPHGTILKESIFNLYTLKIPLQYLVARNAVYRQLYSLYKDREHRIAGYQNNYRDYIKGLTMNTTANDLTYEGVVKDLELLQSIGVDINFNFTEYDLDKGKDNNGKELKRESCGDSGMILRGGTHNNSTSQTPKGNKKKRHLDEEEDELIHLTNNIESIANNLLQEVLEIKSRLLQKKQRKIETQMNKQD